MKTRLYTLIPVLFVVAACSATRLDRQADKDLTQTLLDQKTAMAHCYADALDRDDTTGGRMTIRAEIDERTGEFENVSVVESTVEDAKLEACAVKQAKKAQLEEPFDARIAVTYPVVFAPEP